MTQLITAPWQPAGGNAERIGINYRVSQYQDVWNQALEYLDSILDKDFYFTRSDHSISIQEGNLPARFVGQADAFDGDLYNGKFDIVIDASKIADPAYYGYVIRHELGHALGLKHPHDFSPADVDERGTIMSYFPDSYWFTDLDRAALISINGLEDDGDHVYRFYNKVKGAHFYTADVDEAEWLATVFYDDFSFDGVAYDHGGDIALYRLYNPVSGAHFYSTDEQEVALASEYMIYEGVAYNVSNEGDAVHRALNPHNNSHFYTTDLSEIGDHYIYEGIAYYI